jgi:type I restriction enzyme M protein
MLESETKRRIDTARDILVGKVPDPKSQVEQITIALIYKFMDDMDRESKEMGGKAGFFKGEFKRYRWSNIFDPRLGGHEMLNLYAEAIVKLNQNPGIPQLFRDIFKNAYLPYRDPETLKLFLATINEFEYDHSENLGDAFEYLLSVLGSQGDAGQFRTPRNIIDFMVEVIDPQKNEIIMDPACGTAGFLISSYKHIMKANTKKALGDLLTTSERKKMMDNFRGYDISPDMVRLSLVNLYLHGFSQPKIFEYDTLTSDERWNEYAGVILANPPFMSPKGGIKPHKKFSVQSNRSEVLFVDYIAEHLTTSGRAAVIVPEGIIFQGGTAYKQLRKSLVEKYLYAVVSLPSGVFNPYAGVKTSILFLDPLLAQKSDSILFVKIENDGFSLGAQRRAIDKNDLPWAVEIIKNFQKGLTQRRKGAKDAEGKKEEFLPRTTRTNTNDINYLIVSKDKIVESGEYNLTGERYRKSRTNTFKFPLVKIEDICVTSSGGTPKSGYAPYYEGGKIPWLRSGEVAQGEIFHTEMFITEDGLNNSSAKIFQPDTVLVAMYGATAGEVGILRITAATNQAVCGITPNKNLLPDFLYLLLKYNKQILIRLAGGGAQPNISQKIIRELQIPLPPIEVQREIVTEIEGYQKIINGARQVVDNWKPHIDIDSDWPLVKLGEIAKSEYGFTETAVDSGDARFIRITDIAPNGTLRNDDTKFIKITSEARKSILNKDDILVARTGATFGKTMIFEEDYSAVFASYLIRLRFQKNHILPRFYWIFAQSDLYWNQAKTLVTGGGQPQFNGNALVQIIIPLPPLEIQHTIVAEIEAEQKRVEGCRELIDLYEVKIKTVIERVWGKE